MIYQENISETEMDRQLVSLSSSVGMERAPEDFTQHLMQKIEKEETSGFVYKPVISKVAWIVIGIAVAAILPAALFLFPNSVSTPAAMQKLTGIFNFQFLDGNLFHFENRLLQFLSESHVMLSVLAVAVVIGWQYLFMHGRSNGKRKGITGMLLF